MNNKISIRKFKENDKIEVIDLWDMCGLLVHGLDYNYEIDLKINFQEDLFLVGTLEEKIVATVMAGFEGRRGWLNYVAVHPDYRHNHFGDEIIEHALTLLKDMGCPKVNLLIRKSNHEVAHFYEKIGFEVNDVICMHKKL